MEPLATSPEASPNSDDYHYLDRHNVQCSASQGTLQQFNLRRPTSDTIQYAFMCAEPVSGFSTCYAGSTPVTPSPVGDFHYLDRQLVACKDGFVLSRFQLRIVDSSQMTYDYQCCQPLRGNLGECRDTFTSPSSGLDDGSGLGNDYHYLDRQSVSCTAREALQKFQFHRPSDGTINYLFTCCQLPLL